MVSIATFMEVLDTTIANVALRYIVGRLAVGIDESTWVITSYLVANAIVLSMLSGWLVDVFGRKRFLHDLRRACSRWLAAVRLCLESAIAGALPHPAGPRRRRHGAGGTVDPRRRLSAEKRGQAFALYGIAVVVAPVDRADARRLDHRQSIPGTGAS